MKIKIKKSLTIAELTSLIIVIAKKLELNFDEKEIPNNIIDKFKKLK